MVSPLYRLSSRCCPTAAEMLHGQLNTARIAALLNHQFTRLGTELGCGTAEQRKKNGGSLLDSTTFTMETGENNGKNDSIFGVPCF